MEVVGLSFRFILGWMVLSVGVAKAVNPRGFEDAIRRYAILPNSLVRPAAWFVLGLEVVAGLCLLLGFGLWIVAGLLAALLVAFATAMAANLIRGRSIECGCSATPRTISWTLVARNCVLAAAAVALAVHPPVALSVDQALSGAESALAVTDALAIAIVASVLVQLMVASLEAHRFSRARARLLGAGGRRLRP